MGSPVTEPERLLLMGCGAVGGVIAAGLLRAGFSPSLLPKHALILAVGLTFRRLKSSLLQSLDRGRRPEIDFINGYVVDKGRAKGVPVPVNAALL